MCYSHLFICSLCYLYFLVAGLLIYSPMCFLILMHSLIFLCFGGSTNAPATGLIGLIPTTNG